MLNRSKLFSAIAAIFSLSVISCTGGEVPEPATTAEPATELTLNAESSRALPASLTLPERNLAGVSLTLPQPSAAWQPEQALSLAAVGGAIGETFETIEPYRGFERSVSKHYEMRAQPARGWMRIDAAEASPPEAKGAPLGVEARPWLAERSLELLGRIVELDDGQTFRQREIMALDEAEAGAAEAPARLVGHLGFYQKHINDIPVMGQGARVSRFPDGTLKRLHVRWGAKLAEAQFLETPHSPAEIGTRFLDFLADQGVDDDEVPQLEIALSYVYVPVTHKDGTQSLVLSIDGVLTPGPNHPGFKDEKIRGFLMPIAPGSPDLP